VERWRLKTRGAIYSSPTLVGQMMYFTDRSGDLHALDSRNGSEKWRFPMGTKSFSTPLVSGGMVYCSSDEGIMYGLQGAATADTSTIAVRRAVYWEGAKSDTSYRWFTTEIDRWIRDYFVSAGYEPLTPETLPKFLQEQTRKPTASVVVFADNVVPVSVVEKESKDCLLRKYLDAGGKVVFIGENPLTIKRDSVTGVFRNEDYSIPEKIFDIRYPARNIDAGYYASTPTQEGKQWGFNNFWIGVNSIAPSEATTVLAKNEFGMATAWVKNYGGKKGTGLVQLWIPNEEAVGDIIYSIRMAVEYGLMW
ncbi:MAG TPA: PQQ-binding-like beta-propeller repeat protein, partial [Bacteroidota bacterium]